MASITVGILQAEFARSPLENAEKAIKIISNGYREADLIVLPEYSMLNPLAAGDPHRVYDAAETIIASKYLSGFVKVASELGAQILVHFIERTEQRPYSLSTSVLITSEGEAIPVYSKMHLFDAYGFRESDFFVPGRKLGKILSIGNVKLAVAICFDLRFPELFRSYALMGAEVLVVQAGWVRGPYKEEILDKLASVRAHENTAYLVLADQTGEMFVGRSGVFNPFGYRELDLGVMETYREYAIDTSLVNEARRKIPTLSYSKSRWSISLLTT